MNDPTPLPPTATHHLRHHRSVLAVAVALLPLVGAWTPAKTEAQVRTLTDALRRAVEVHPSLEEARAAAAAAEAGIGGARAPRLPGVSVQGTAVRFEEPMLVAPLHRFDPTAVPAFDQTLIQGTLGFDWTLFDGGRTGARIDRARAWTAVGEEGVRDAEGALLQRTADAFLGVLTARELVAALERHVTALTAERDRARRLFEEGAAPELTLLRADAELASALAGSESARQRLVLARTTLENLLDLPDNALDPVSLVSPPVPGALPPAGPRAELEASPPLAAARNHAAAAQAELAAARAAWLPTLSAVGGYNLFAGGSVSPVAEWQGGVRVSYPVFTGGARRSATDAAQAEARRARARLEAVTEELEMAVSATRVAESEARARLQASEAAVASFEALARVERLALDEGAGIQSDWLRAEAGLQQARSSLAEARHQVLAARIAWARTTGSLNLTWIEQLLEETR